MSLFTKEYYEALEMFESQFKFKPERESKEMWASGQVFCNGEINRDWKSFEKGYALARCVYLNG